MNTEQELPQFAAFKKIPRLSRDCTISCKLDGTNAQVFISEDGLSIKAGSRNRWITPGDDNFGFAAWVEEHRDELLTLGPGRHFGEWIGKGIQRNYGLADRRFYMFNTAFDKPLPECVKLVPVLYQGPFTTFAVDACLNRLRETGSAAVEGFMQPEGVCVYHHAACSYFKKTLENDHERKDMRRPV